MILFLDDIRIPSYRNWTIARSFNEAIEICKKECPVFISFDHDLGCDDEGYVVKSGYDFAKWLVNKDIEAGGKYIPKEFNFAVHSSNPCGKENIIKYLINYLRIKGE
jgi:hypothetical protein